MNGLAGLGTLTRLAVRRDRIMLASWVYALTAVAYASVDATKNLYPTVASRQAFAASAGANRVTVAMYGPAGDLHTLGGLGLWKMNAYGAILVAIMSMVIVIRHTRGDEDAGRLELVGAGAVGRFTPLASGLLTALIANLAVALVVAVGLTFAGVPGVNSLAYGLGLAGAGCAFAAVAAVAAQVAGSARTATGLTAAVVGVAYVLRAIGDTALPGSWVGGLTWISPIGWMERIRPFGPTYWWLLLILLAFALAVTAAAVALAARRDLGAGLVPVRPGAAEGGPDLRGPLGLAWRLQRGALLGWVSGFALGGVIVGALAGGVGALVGNSQAARNMFYRLGGHAGLTDAYLAACMAVFGLLAAVYAVQAALRLRSEETGQRAEPVLAGAVGRTRWAMSHLVFVLGGPVVLLATGGLVAGLVHGAGAPDLGAATGQALSAALVEVPAAWMVGGVAAVLFGVAPRLTAAAWGALVVFLFLAEFGSLLGLSQWAIDLSPFTHIPKLPAASFTPAPLAWLTALALGLAAAGLAGLRRRDMT